MKEEQLIKLMDEYMKNNGYYMKPMFNDESDNFFIAKGPATSENVRKSFDTVSESLGIRIQKEVQIFSAQPKVECAVCSDVPNMMEVVPDNIDMSIE